MQLSAVFCSQSTAITAITAFNALLTHITSLVLHTDRPVVRQQEGARGPVGFRAAGAQVRTADSRPGVSYICICISVVYLQCICLVLCCEVMCNISICALTPPFLFFFPILYFLTYPCLRVAFLSLYSQRTEHRGGGACRRFRAVV